jgi:cytochrome P450 family 6
MPMNCLEAQAFVFFAAGFETSSTNVTFCLYELAINPDIQETLQNEIDTVLGKHDSIPYESIQQIAYLDKDVAVMKLPVLYFVT